MKKYTIESIAGYEEEKAELLRLIEIFKNRKKYEEKGAKLPKGIIFYGGAGNGKTLFAKVLASECNLNTITIDIGKTESVGDICKQIKKTFSQAFRKKEPTMIFFDELDKILPCSREDYHTDQSKTILTQLLTLIDGMESSSNVIFVATCNYYSDLPETIVRPGRIDKKISIPSPSYESRIKIIDFYKSDSPCRFEMESCEIARLSSGFSCAALETLVNECVLSSDENNFVSAELTRRVFSEIKNEDITKGASSFQERLFAIRNLGSFVVARSLNDGNYTLNIDQYTVCNDFFNNICSEYDDDFGIADDNCEDDNCDEDYYDDDYYDEGKFKSGTVASKNDLLNAITVLLGAFASQELLLNKTYDNICFHFALIDDILLSMSKNGMLGFNLRYNDMRSNELPYDNERISKFNDAFEAIFDECHQKARKIVGESLDIIKSLTPVLLEKKSIEKKELEPILKNLGGNNYAK